MITIQDVVCKLADLNNSSPGFRLIVKRKKQKNLYSLFLYHYMEQLGCIIPNIKIANNYRDKQVMLSYSDLYNAEDLLPSEIDIMYQNIVQKSFIQEFRCKFGGNMLTPKEGQVQICINGNWYIFSSDGYIALEHNELNTKIFLATDKTVDEMIEFINVLRR